VAIQHSAEAETGSLNLLNLRTLDNRMIELPGRPGFFAETRQPGIVVVGLERRLALLDIGRGQVEETGLTVTNDPRVIINDGLAVPGGLLFGTKDLKFREPLGHIYYFDAARREVRAVLDGQYCSNGKFFYESGGRAFVADIDSLPKKITIYEFDSERTRLTPVRTVADFGGMGLFPDGLRPTPDGESIIVAFYNPQPDRDGLAQQIRMRDGAVEREWVIPGSPRVTCPELLRVDGKGAILFTTAIEGAQQETMNMGAMFLAESGIEAEPIAPPLVNL
jgi:sugar lactone lactonase YvrE